MSVGNSLATASGGKNAAQPINIASEKVHNPMQAPIPRWRTSDSKRTSGRKAGIQINTQNVSSQKTVKWLRSSISPGMPRQPRHVDRLVFEVSKHHPHRLAVPPGHAQQLRNAGEKIDNTHVNLNEAQGEIGGDAR